MLMQAFRDVFTPYNTIYLLKGLGMTVGISVATVLLSIILGTILALLRNYDKLVLGKLAGVYIEVFRNTPLLLWILVCVFMLLFGTPVIRGGLALILYTSSVIAEIVRGGLNSISAGQFEAAKAQGFNFLQSLWYVALPQCFRRIIPSLMSQIVTTIKDTSFLYQVAIAEFFYRAKTMMGSLSNVTTVHVFTIFITVAIVYFLINFTLSSLARRVQKRLVA